MTTKKKKIFSRCPFFEVIKNLATLTVFHNMITYHNPIDCISKASNELKVDLFDTITSDYVYISLCKYKYCTLIVSFVFLVVICYI